MNAKPVHGLRFAAQRILGVLIGSANMSTGLGVQHGILGHGRWSQSIELAPAMKLTLMAWFIPVTLLMAGLVTVRYRLNRRQRAADGLLAVDAPATALGETT